MARKKKIDKETLISEEFKRLTVIFQDIPNEKRELCTNLMQNISPRITR